MDEARRRRRLTMLLVPIAALVVASNIGGALAPKLAVDHPLLLLALDARNRNVFLVAGQLDAISYYVVGTLRLLLSDPLFFLLGYWYGEAALSWMDRKAGSIGEFLREMEGFFEKATYPLLFLAPNNYICLFAGAARMRPAVFLTINVTGTVTRLFLIRALGEEFDAPRQTVLDFIGKYQLPLTVVTVSLVVGQLLWEKRKGKTQLGELAELEHELERQDPLPADAPGVDLARRAETADAPDERDDPPAG